MATLKQLVLEYGLFLSLLVGSALGHVLFPLLFVKTTTQIRVPVTDREAGRTSVAIQIVAAKPKPKLELEEIVKETRPKELPKPTELLIAKAELPPEKIVTAEIPSPKAPPVAAPPPPPPIEKIDEEVPPEDKPPEPKKRKKQVAAKVPVIETIETEAEVSIMTKEMRGVDQPPRLLANPDPPYPRSLWERRVQGNLELSVRIDENGRAVTVSVLRSSGYEEMDRSAVEAIRNWKFQPAMSDGQPVAHDVTIPVRFTIRN